MPLDPQAQAVLETMPLDQLPDLSTIPPALFREAFESMGPPPQPEEVASVEEHLATGPGGEIRVRLYTPDGLAANAPQPTLVYFHGGGFVIGSLDSHDTTCRSLANAARCRVASVDYRLAPEAKFPAAPEDCYAATRWLAQQGAALGVDASRIAVGGDSAGGNLAAAVTLLARERGGPALVHQLLVYPVTHHAFDTKSYSENAQGYLLSRDMMQWFWGHYLAKETDGSSPIASPLLASDLAGLPPATVFTAQYDPLRDEGEAYTERLSAAGVPTHQQRYDGMFHGFFAMPGAIDTARAAVDEAGRVLREAFSR